MGFFYSLKWVRNRQPSGAQIDSLKYLSSLMFGKGLKKQIHPHATRAGWMGNYIPSLGSNKHGDEVGCTRPKIIPTMIKAVVTTTQQLFLPTGDQQIKAETHHLELSWDVRLLLEKNSIPFQKKNPDISSKLDILSFPSGQS